MYARTKGPGVIHPKRSDESSEAVKGSQESVFTWEILSQILYLLISDYITGVVQYVSVLLSLGNYIEISRDFCIIGINLLGLFLLNMTIMLNPSQDVKDKMVHSF